MKKGKKLYLMYLCVPDEMYRKIEGLQYIYKHFDYSAPYDMWSGLYGYTTSEKMALNFMDIHNKKYFKVVSLNKNNDEFVERMNEIQRDKTLDILVIKNHEYLTKKGTVCLPTTKFEKHLSSNDDIDDSTNILLSKTLSNEISPYIPEPYMFNNHIYKSLVALGMERIYYNFICDIDSIDPDDELFTMTESESEIQERMEAFQYNEGFSLSMTGDIVVTYPETDELNTFISLFGPLLN